MSVTVKRNGPGRPAIFLTAKEAASFLGISTQKFYGVFLRKVNITPNAEGLYRKADIRQAGKAWQKDTKDTAA